MPGCSVGLPDPDPAGLPGTGADRPGWRCAVCGITVAISAPFTWRCPAATTKDPHHLLQIIDTEPQRSEGGLGNSENPLIRYGPRLAWWRWARAHGLSDQDCAALTEELVGDFRVTPYAHNEVLSERIGARVYVKDETGSVAGSQKTRHLVSIMLHLLATEKVGLLTERAPLAIASCGNAALAAATLARRVQWPIQVFVPEWMDPAYGEQLAALGPEITRCVRRSEDPSGDPALHRFRDAVANGAIPFSVQGPENAYCLDAGRTMGWEILDDPVGPPEAMFVQVGGGAFASCLGAGLGPSVQLWAVQAAGCAPLDRAWKRMSQFSDPLQHWSEIMTPWEAPASVADGILDDETYDWIGVMQAMQASGGAPVVASEDQILEANALARAAGYNVSHTGSAGLAGLLAKSADFGPTDRIAVVMSGVARR
jgi:threonine synthase